MTVRAGNERLVREAIEPVPHDVAPVRQVALLDVLTDRVVLQRRLLVERAAAEARKRSEASVREHVAGELGLALPQRPALWPAAHEFAPIGRRTDGPRLARGSAWRLHRRLP